MKILTLNEKWMSSLAQILKFTFEHTLALFLGLSSNVSCDETNPKVKVDIGGVVSK